MEKESNADTYLQQANLLRARPTLVAFEMYVFGGLKVELIQSESYFSIIQQASSTALKGLRLHAIEVGFAGVMARQAACARQSHRVYGLHFIFGLTNSRHHSLATQPSALQGFIIRCRYAHDIA